MNVRTQMQECAEAIVPGVNLKTLLSRVDTRKIPRRKKQRIKKLLESGNTYFNPDFLSAYYPINLSTLNHIKNDKTI